MSKTTKTKTSRSLRTFEQMFARNAGGRIVGISALRDGKLVKYNGQIAGQSANYVKINDRNRRATFKLAKRCIVTVTGV